MDLTRREYFAALALQGLLANGMHSLHHVEGYAIEHELFVRDAIKIADEMIEQLDASLGNNQQEEGE